MGRGRKLRRRLGRTAAGYLARQLESGRAFVGVFEVEGLPGFSAPVGTTLRMGVSFGPAWCECQGHAVRVPGGWTLRHGLAVARGATPHPGPQGSPLRGGAARRP